MHSKSLGRAAAILALAVALPSGSLRAQVGKGGQIELGTYGVMTWFDRDVLGVDRDQGAGGRLAWHLTRLLSLEAAGDFTLASPPGSSVGQLEVTRLGGTLYGHTQQSPFGVIYLGAGYERLYYRGGVVGEDDGLHGVLGDRFSLGSRTALRVEGRVSYFPTSVFSATEKPLNIAATVGLSVFAFGGPPRDADHDGVANHTDQCPGTPRGALVDAAGCPTDEDADGVYDGLDDCPGTPAGAFVDQVGCPTDTDNDGVYDGIDVCPNTPLNAVVDDNGCPTDADDDGVFDGIDACPDTPRGATVDVVGCPGDDDLDTVLNGLDQCPNTPAGTPVDATGCPADTDRDGVLNDVDQCPNTPPGTEVNERGCPLERDGDGDGVPDSRDRCPNTAPGQSVDAVGCAILFVIEEGGRRQPLILRGVNFETGRSAITRESYTVLDEVAASLVAHPEVRIEIAGHTDSTGPRSLNMRLSQERATAVKAFLARRGVDPGRMMARGYGPDRPVATNTTPDGRAQNRRVELHPLEEGQPE